MPDWKAFVRARLALPSVEDKRARDMTEEVASQLFGVSATDPLTFALTPLLVLLVGSAAVLLPARQATRVDPAKALQDG